MTILQHAGPFARLLTGESVNGELLALPEPLRAMADLLSRVSVDEALDDQARREALASARAPLWEAMMAARPDRNDYIKALADYDPSGPPSEAAPAQRCATLADLRNLVSGAQWVWKGWLAAGVLNGLASDPGTGKTIMAADLARRLWFGLCFPDGQLSTLPEGTRTLWVPGDRHYTQLIGLADHFGMPDDAVLFNAPASDPTAGLDMDDPTELRALADRIQAERPGLVIVDTVGQTTGKNLCKPEDARDYFGPLMDLGLQTGVPFLLLTHLSKDGNALGRRINGACRLVWKMTAPDPDGQPNRRRVWVDKTYAEKPVPLGMAIAETGCDFDFNPPSEPTVSKGGRPGDGRDKASRFIRDALSAGNDQVGNTLCSECNQSTGVSESTFWRAARDMQERGELTTDGGKGKGKQTILHLVDRAGDPPDSKLDWSDF